MKFPYLLIEWIPHVQKEWLVYFLGRQEEPLSELLRSSKYKSEKDYILKLVHIRAIFQSYVEIVV